MKKHRPGELDALYFDKLPQRCKEMFFQFLNQSDISATDKINCLQVLNFYCDDCESPIEQMLTFAFEIIAFCRGGLASGMYLIPQYEIDTGKRLCRADFVFDTNECESPYTHFEKPFKLVIECDGHDFHEKTKAQVKKDNERDMAIKMAGYDILHFSGSQIYNEPFKCAKSVIDYILLNVGGEHEQGLDMPTQEG